MIASIQLTVRYGETDQMGIVYHSNYFRYFEVARTALFKQLGYSYKRFEEEGFLLPLTACQCTFKSPAKYDDSLLIEVKISQFSGVRLTIDYCIYYANTFKKQLLAEGETTHAIVDRTFKPINIKKHKPEFFKLIKSVD